MPKQAGHSSHTLINMIVVIRHQVAATSPGEDPSGPFWYPEDVA